MIFFLKGKNMNLNIVAFGRRRKLKNKNNSNSINLFLSKGDNVNLLIKEDLKGGLLRGVVKCSQVVASSTKQSSNLEMDS